MEDRRRVLVVSSSHFTAYGVQQLLAHMPDAISCQLVSGSELSAVSPVLGQELDVVLVVPQAWEDLFNWLPLLRTKFSALPWLVLANPRLAGAFFSTHETQPCTLVSPNASAEELWSAVRAVSGNRLPCPPAMLLGLYIAGAPPPPKGRQAMRPTPMELQCGCAASLRLTDRQIATVLGLGEATVKSHLRHLRRKLQLKSRADLATFFDRALASYSPPPSTEKAPPEGAEVTRLGARESPAKYPRRRRFA
jgi:DNA-binding NarL/FixJ family response regulator